MRCHEILATHIYPFIPCLYISIAITIKCTCRITHITEESWYISRRQKPIVYKAHVANLIVLSISLITEYMLIEVQTIIICLFNVNYEVKVLKPNNSKLK